MKNCFEFHDRRGSDSVKWDPVGMLNMVKHADEDSLPLWVADMDFKTVPLAIQNLKERIENGIFGYNISHACYRQPIIDWYKQYYNWNIQEEWIITTSGIVPAIAYFIQIFTKESEGVIIQEPVYYPFRKIIELNNREVINNELIESNGEYSIDFDDLETKAKNPNNKLMILCSPHNPIGRIWTKEELTKIAKICLDNNVILCSDEIHSDLILGDNVFVSAGCLSKELVNNIIVCTAPSKTFNLAALSTSNIIIPNDTLRSAVKNFMEKLSLNGAPSMIGCVAVKSVYTPEGREWLDCLLEELNSNLEYIKAFFKEHLPAVKIHNHQSTYLVWLDFRETGLPWEDIERIMEDEAKVVLDPGSKFGEKGRGFMRINIGCHKSTLEEALLRIQKAYQ